MIGNAGQHNSASRWALVACLALFVAAFAQLNVLRRRVPSNPKLAIADRLVFVWLYRLANFANRSAELRALYEMVNEGERILLDRSRPLAELGELLHDAWTTKRSDANSGVGHCGRSSMSPTTCPLGSEDIFIISARYLVVWPLRVMRDSLLGREDSCFLHRRFVWLRSCRWEGARWLGVWDARPDSARRS